MHPEGVSNARITVSTLTRSDVLEAIAIAQRIVDWADSLNPPRALRNPRQDRCDCGFVDHGRGRCWTCDPSVVRDRQALVARKQLRDIEGRDRRRNGR